MGWGGGKGAGAAIFEILRYLVRAVYSKWDKSLLKSYLVRIRGEPMSKKSRLPIPIVNSRYLPTIGRLIGKTDGHLNFFY